LELGVRGFEIGRIIDWSCRCDRLTTFRAGARAEKLDILIQLDRSALPAPPAFRRYPDRSVATSVDGMLILPPKASLALQLVSWRAASRCHIVQSSNGFWVVVRRQPLTPESHGKCGSS
jgi:hypothetical protein